MSLFAEWGLGPGGVVAWLVVGLVGAGLGGLLSGMFVTGTPGAGGGTLVSFPGACGLIWLVRWVAARRGGV